ncbi:LPD7 domain-containing protein [Paraburkholderia sp. HD33-4]|uniref:LPD7 domain-containing protein n=1 Tax=Paraburkholderia sp. HD33-4 TaxID=2883242 RepID=UPI001F33172C|nr:LPD7 domain-containing protein [Paraburkholderia sp. HD33-4]
MNEIEFPEDQLEFHERDAANSDDAAAIRARQMLPASEPNAGTVSKAPETSLDEATQERMKKIRGIDRRKVEVLLKDSPAVDDAVKPAPGIGRTLAAKEGDNSIRPKPIVEKTGYEIPKSVRDQYVAFEGKYLDRKSEAVHFEDKGRSLATASEDREVIQHMVAVAQAKHWSELQLKGSDEFRRQAWIAAELAGVPTRGFRPKAQDRATLASAREAMRIAAGERSTTDEPARTNTVESAADAKSPERPVASDENMGRGKGVPRTAGEAPRASRGIGFPGPDSPAPAAVPPGGGAGSLAPKEARQQAQAALQTTTPQGVTLGELIAHGSAPFNHDPKHKDSYYATVRTQEGERTVWGLDLERAIAESGVQIGQRIELEKGGSRQVTILQRQFDGRGREIDSKPVTSRRNEWLVWSPDVAGLPTREQRQQMASVRREIDERRRINEARERFLSGNWRYTKEQQAMLEAARERIKELAAREVLEDEIKGLPEQQKDQLRGEFESAVAEARATNRPLDVPMPQVSDATIEAVREQIEREHATQEPSQQHSGNLSTESASEQPSLETGHEAPPFELEP